VFTARALGPEGRGLLAVALAVGALGMQLGNLGLHLSNAYHVSKDPSELPLLISNSLIMSLGVGGLGALLAAGVFMVKPEWAPVKGLLLPLSLLYIPLGLAYLFLQNLSLGLHKIRLYNKLELGNKVSIVLIMLIFFYLRGFTPVNVFLAYLLSLAFIFSANVFSLQPNPFSLRFSWSVFRRELRYGLRFYVGAFFSYITIKIDLLMVQYILGSRQAGYYSIDSTMADLVLLLPMTVAALLFPKVAAVSDWQTKWKLTKKAASVMGLVMLPACIVVAILARIIVRLLFGASYLPAVEAFRYLAPGIFFLSISLTLGIFMAASGQPWYSVAPYLISAVLNVLLNLYFIPRLGIVGASLTSSVTYAGLFVAVLWVTKRVHLRRMSRSAS